MKRSNITLIILLSAFALGLLVVFQVNWIQAARQLREEQFDHRVKMALCKAVDQVSTDSSFCQRLNGCSRSASCTVPDFSERDTSVFATHLRTALGYYELPMDYEFRLVPNAQPITFFTSNQFSPYPNECSFEPITQNEDWKVQVWFPEKSQYVLGQMGFMLWSCLLVIFFVSCFCILTIRTVWKQQRIADRNVGFFNNMAHEFQTPLTNINLSASMLAKKLEAHPSSKRFVSVIQEEGKKLIQEVEQILQLSRMEQIGTNLQLQEADINVLIQEVVESMRIQVESRSGSLQLDLYPHPLFINIDVHHIKKVLTNLIDNAVKYTKENPWILIRSVPEEDTIHICVKDNGKGIAQVDQAHIFDKFFRASNGNQHDVKGFGLGLAYVKQVIRAHGGSIGVKSHLGKGTQIFFSLPKHTVYGE